MKDPKMLAQLADLMRVEARAVMNPFDHADELDRPQMPRRITITDHYRAQELRLLSARLLNTARRHGFKGPLYRAWE